MKPSAALVVLGAALLGIAATVPGRAQQAGQEDRGRQVFEYWCAPCHAPGPKHPGTQALEALYRGAKPAPLEQRNDLAPSETKYFVRNGVSIMPPFRKTEITDAELAALAAYLAPKHQ